MKKECFKGIDFYDSEFRGFQYESDNLLVLIELWKANRVILEFQNVKFFSLDSYDANAIPYFYDGQEHIPKIFNNQDIMSELKHIGLEDISNKPFLNVFCSGIRLIEI